MDREGYINLISKKKEEGKKLNQWDNKVVKLLDSLEKGYSEQQWTNDQIDEVIRKRQEYIDKQNKKHRDSGRIINKK